jgi:hypothetical protein
MFTMAIDRRGRFNRKMPSKAWRFGALLGTLIVLAVTVNALIIVADGKLRQRPAAVQDCSTITETPGGRTCSDSLARRSAPQPTNSASAAALDRAL